MSPKLLILRPRDGAAATAKRASGLGMEPVVDPLFAIEPIGWDAPPAEAFDSLMVTSANAVIHAGAGLQDYHDLPVLAVGEATAQAAQAAGLTVAVTGGEGAQALLASLPADRYQQILRLTGKDHVKLASTERSITLRKTYQARALSLGSLAQQTLADGGQVILLYSVRAAKLLTAEMKRLRMAQSRHHVVALSANIAAAAGDGWLSVGIADHPTDDALLDAAGRLCLG